MWETLLKVVAVYLSSAVKFILGPGVGLAERLHFATTVIATIAGMMTTVVCITYFGGWLRKRFGKKKTKLFRSAEERRRRERWKKYGLVGIAALTPVILTPIGGTLLAVSSGSPRQKILLYMLVSATGWALIFTSVFYFFGEKVLPEFMR
ncbi:MAG: hypothetical protein K1X47_15840 [Cyclobacteriaceae bacterium]|nr:hypothetical protein [Cyclobacteriaceae bacterium]